MSYEVKKIRLREGGDYVPAKERVRFLKENGIDYKIATSHWMETVGERIILVCKAILTIFDKGSERTYPGTSAMIFTGEGSEYETTETKAIGRACGAYGIGIEESYATADEVSDATKLPENVQAAVDDIRETIYPGGNITPQTPAPPVEEKAPKTKSGGRGSKDRSSSAVESAEKLIEAKHIPEPERQTVIDAMPLAPEAENKDVKEEVFPPSFREPAGAEEAPWPVDDANPFEADAGKEDAGNVNQPSGGKLPEEPKSLFVRPDITLKQGAASGAAAKEPEVKAPVQEPEKPAEPQELKSKQGVIVTKIGATGERDFKAMLSMYNAIKVFDENLDKFYKKYMMTYSSIEGRAEWQVDDVCMKAPAGEIVSVLDSM